METIGEIVLRWIIPAALTGALGVMTTQVHRLQAASKAARAEEVAISEGLKSLLRDRLIQSYNYYVHTKKECPIYARDNITGMHNAYKALGGNGPIDKLVEDVMELPTANRNGGEI